jgi:autotransporter-associated beta strand protein
MLTTSNNKMSDGVRFLGTGQTSPTGESIAWTAPDGLPDERWGWGIPDLAKGIYGPGQLLSPMTYNMDEAPLDVWSNDIGQIAIKEREKEDLEWLAAYKEQGIDYAGEFSPNVLNPDGTLDEQAFVVQGILNDPQIQAITGGHPELYDKITYEEAVRWRTEWMDQRAAYIQSNIDNDLYTASLTKKGPGSLIMTGDDTYEGGTTVEGGKLSITGSHASSIDVRGGTLGGSGSVAGSIDVDSGVLQPGLSSADAAEAASITDAHIASGNVLDVGGDVTVRRAGGLAITIYGDDDYTSVRAAGDLVLDGELSLDIRAPLPPGTVLTIASGDSIQGSFHSLPERRVLNVDGHMFRVSYEGGDVTLTVERTLPGAGSGGD